MQEVIHTEPDYAEINAGGKTRESADGHKIYASKIIKAGALLSDTKMMLAHWDRNLTAEENLDCFKQENIFGKASRVRIADMLAIFKQRYLASEETTKALVVLLNGRLSAQVLDRIFYFYAAQSDALLHDTVTEILSEFKRVGRHEVTTADVESRLTRWVEEGKTAGRWSEHTITRIAQGLLATLRDFGVLEGAVRKRFATIYLPIEAFAYIAFCLHKKQPSGERLINDPEWQLFFLDGESVEKLFLEAHQRGLLEYHAAGPVIRIEFPTNSLEEYARVITERSY